MNHLPAFPEPQPAREADGHARGEEILAAARAAFAEKGFAGASMQDLARAAGMSAGNFYRYFPSKDAIVEALIARDIAEIDDGFRRIVAAADPMVAMREALREQLDGKTCGEENTLWAEISATALRKPSIAAVLGRMEDNVVAGIAAVMGHIAGIEREEALGRFGTHARLVFLIVHGAMTSGLGRHDRDDALVDLILRTVERLTRDAVADAKDAP